MYTVWLKIALQYYTTIVIYNLLMFRDVLNLLNYTKSGIKHYKLKNDNAFEVHLYMTLHQQNENSSRNVMLRNYHDVSP